MLLQKSEITSCMQKALYFWNHSTCAYQNYNYVESIIGDSVITCDKTIKVTKTLPIKTVLIKTVPTVSIPTKSTLKILTKKR